MSKPIHKLVDELPTSGMTVRVLKALDWVVPGEWDNLVGFENTIKAVTGEEDQAFIQKIGDRAIALYNDKSQGYQRAVWLYQTVETINAGLASAALASKVGEKVSFLRFLDKITPKADTSQAIDLGVKLMVEVVAFCQINGIPGDSVGDFVKSLASYSGEAKMRMAALVCLDGLLPLGPDFIAKVSGFLEKLGGKDLEQNESYQKVKDLIPGGDPAERMNFIRQSMDSVKGWMNSFVSSSGATREKIFGNLRSFMEVADDKLDWVAAFLDLTTNYYEHTGIQTVARRLITRAVNEV